MCDDNVCETLLEKLRTFSPESDRPDGLRYAAAKLHQRITASDKFIREKTMEKLRRKQSGHVTLLMQLLQTVREPRTLHSLTGILRECVSSEPGPQRANQVLQMLSVNASATLLELLVIHNTTNREPICDALSLNLLWLLGRLAVRDPKFASKVRSLGAARILHYFLRSNTGNSKQIYPLLQIFKVITEHTRVAEVLVRDGISSTIETLLLSIGAAAHSRLRVLTKIILNLSKIRPFVAIMAKSSLVPLILRPADRWDNFGGKLRLRIMQDNLLVLSHICTRRAGRKSIVTANGLQSLRRFCRLCPQERAFDALLTRVCSIINFCTERRNLPVVDSFGPARFPLKGTNPSYELAIHNEPVESDESGEDSDDNGDDEVDLVDDEDDDDGLVIDFNPQDRLIDDLPQSCKGEGLAQRRAETYDVQKYASFFQEMFTSTTPNNTLGPTPGGPLRIFNGLMDPSGANDGDPELPVHVLRETYCQMASNVRSVLRFSKVAYPDLVGGEIRRMEALSSKDRRVCRTKLLQCVERCIQPATAMNVVVYDLDALMANNNANKDRQLTNNDEQRLGVRESNLKHLKFESRFEGGNLRKAIQIGQTEYDLVLSSDVNSSRHHQWFYFEVSNMQSDQSYSFNIINNEKSDSQFNFGMQPVVYSVRAAVAGKPGWVHMGSEICYYRNSYRNPHAKRRRSYLTTTFTLNFPYSLDVCYIAYHYPYTYTHLLHQLWRWRLKVDPNKILLRTEALCDSLQGNQVPVVTISAQSRPQNSITNREVVMLTARVHPGESNSSYCIHGALNTLLTSDSPAAVKLRERYVFKVVPMLNIEGVINGCHRCGLTNEDLNRRWICPDEKLHPEIYHTKGLLDFSSRALQRLPAVFIDFHGHSRKKNIFMYGCSGAESWNSGDRAAAAAAAAAVVAASSQPRVHSVIASANGVDTLAGPNDHRVLPELMGKLAPAFCLSSCSFRVERCRESTARVTVWREFGIRCSYTLEASYCGCDQGRYQGYHLSAVHLKEVGNNLCQSLAVLREELALRRSLLVAEASKEGPGAPTSEGIATPSTSTTSFTTCSTTTPVSRVSPANSSVSIRRRPSVQS